MLLNIHGMGSLVGRLLLVWVLWGGGMWGVAQAQSPTIPPLTDWVVDTTQTFTDAEKQALSQRLQQLEQSKGAQLFVLMVPTTDNESIDLYTRQVYDQWKLGRKKVDDGVLLVVAKDDRRLRIEVGYGLEGAITDLQAGRIIREYITPYFAQNQYVQGINSGVNALIALIEKEDLPPPPAQMGGVAAEDDDEAPYAVLLPLVFFSLILPPLVAAIAVGAFSFFAFGSTLAAIILAIIAVVLSLVGKGLGYKSAGNAGRASRHGSAAGGLGGFGAGRHGGGGGFGGGSSGGFGGGGGGSSGGGGASGSW